MVELVVLNKKCGASVISKEKVWCVSCIKINSTGYQLNKNKKYVESFTLYWNKKYVESFILYWDKKNDKLVKLK